jgi:hypothetical protein
VARYFRSGERKAESRGAEAAVDDYLTAVVDRSSPANPVPRAGGQADDAASESEEFSALAADVSQAWEPENGTDRFFAEFLA